MGECGLRGGYVQFDNFDPQVYVHFKKMISAKLCSTVLGQVVLFLFFKKFMERWHLIPSAFMFYRREWVGF